MDVWKPGKMDVWKPAFEAFRKRHRQGPDFAVWQKASRPLGELDALQKILKLSAIAVFPRPPMWRLTAAGCSTNPARRTSAQLLQLRPPPRPRGHSSLAAPRA